MDPAPAQERITRRKTRADRDDNARIRYVEAGEGPKAALLIHGAPQTWYAWRGNHTTFGEDREEPVRNDS